MTTDFVGLGWAYPVGVRDNGSVATVGGVTNLEKAMRIVLVTQVGERPMRPNFGSRLREFLFEGVTPESAVAIADEVQRALHSCEPRVIIDSVDVHPSGERPSVFDIDIAYTVRSTNEAYNLVVPFYSIPGEED